MTKEVCLLEGDLKFQIGYDFRIVLSKSRSYWYIFAQDAKFQSFGDEMYSRKEIEDGAIFSLARKLIVEKRIPITEKTSFIYQISGSMWNFDLMDDKSIIELLLRLN